jgi:predicted nucleic acid-binding protein
VIIADTSALLALFNDREPTHASVRTALRTSGDALVLSPYVVAELDYLVATRHGVDAEISVLRELTSNAYEHAMLGATDLSVAARIVEKYRDQNIGLADASLVVLAERYGTTTIATLDRRHFSVVRPLGRRHRFHLIP